MYYGTSRRNAANFVLLGLAAPGKSAFGGRYLSDIRGIDQRTIEKNEKECDSGAVSVLNKVACALIRTNIDPFQVVRTLSIL